MKKSFKQWQMDKNIMDAVACIDMFLSTKAKTIKLLQLILPIGWRLSKKENNIKWIERDLTTIRLNVIVDEYDRVQTV